MAPTSTSGHGVTNATARDPKRRVRPRRKVLNPNQKQVVLASRPTHAVHIRGSGASVGDRRQQWRMGGMLGHRWGRGRQRWTKGNGEAQNPDHAWDWNILYMHAYNEP